MLELAIYFRLQKLIILLVYFFLFSNVSLLMSTCFDEIISFGNIKVENTLKMFFYTLDITS